MAQDLWAESTAPAVTPGTVPTQGAKDLWQGGGAAPAPAPPQGFDTPIPTLAGKVRDAATKYGVPLQVAEEFMSIESSGGRNTKTSSSGAVGPMQMKPDTFKAEGGTGDVADPGANIDTGVKMMARLLKKYHDPAVAYGAYHDGDGAMDSWLQGKGDLSAEGAAAMARISAKMTPHNEVPLPDVHRDRAVAHIAAKADPLQPAKDFIGSLNRPIAGTASAATLKDALTIPSPGATTRSDNIVGKHNAHENNDARNANYSWIDQVGGHEDLPFILSNALAKDKMLGTGTKYRDHALQLYAKNPAAAATLYGLNAVPMLQLYAQHGNPVEQVEAKFYMQHPTVLGVSTFAEEMLNPVGILEGAGVGKVAGVAARAMQATAPGRALLNFASPFKGIAMAAGDKAKMFMARLVQNTNHAEQSAMHDAVNTVSGTHAQKLEILRHSEQVHTGAVHADPIVQEKAQKYRDLIKEAIATQTKHKIQKSTVDEDTFHPLRNAMRDPELNDEQMDIVNQLREAQSGGYRSVRALENDQPFNSINDALKGNKKHPSGSHLRDDYDPTTELYKYLKAARSNDIFETAMKDMPKELRVNASKAVKLKPPKDLAGNIFTPAARLFPGVLSPTLRKSYISPALAGWLKKHGGSMLSGQALDGPKTLGEKLADPVGAFASSQTFRKFNSAMRQVIIQNPVVHPLWNIATNASAARGVAIPGMVANYSKALFGVARSVPGLFPGGEEAVSAAEARFMPRANQYAQTVLNASQRAALSVSGRFPRIPATSVEAGAHAEFGAGATALGGEGAHIRSTAYSGLGRVEKIDKFLTHLGDWNRKAVFGKRGEGAFADDVYQSLIKQGWLPDEAAYGTREALGNYANVDPNSIQTKLLFFYPWLKSNSAFWLSTLGKNPRYIEAPQEGIRRHNEAVGDPRAYSATNRTKDFQIYRGTQNGQPTYTTPLLPQRMLNEVLGVVDPRGIVPGLDLVSGGEGSGPSPADRIKSTQTLLDSRMQPAVLNAADAITTANSAPADPALPQNYHTMYNKDAPPAEQWRQIGTYLLQHDVPMPGGSVATEALGGRIGTHPEDALQALAGGGFTTRYESPTQDKQVYRAWTLFTKHLQTKRKQFGNGAITKEQFDKSAGLLYKTYEQQRDRAFGKRPTVSHGAASHNDLWSTPASEPNSPAPEPVKNSTESGTDLWTQ